MVKLRRILPITKFILGASALLMWMINVYFYQVYVKAGNSVATSTNPVKVNVHGSIVYITASQDRTLTLLTAAAISTFVIAVLIDLYLRKYPTKDES